MPLVCKTSERTACFIMEAISGLSIEEVCVKVGLSDISQGLSDSEVMERRLQGGPNKLPENKSGLLSKAKKFTIENRQIMTFIGAMLLLVFTIRHDSSASLCAHLFFVVFSIIPTLYRYYGSFKDQAREVEEEDVTVVAVRRGLPTAVKQEFLVIGDVVVLKAGDFVPADIRIIEATNLRADEASLTGYTEVKVKSPQSCQNAPLGEAKCLLLMGSKIVEGSCKGVVYATGRRTLKWRLTQLASDISTESLTKQQSRLIVYALMQTVLGVLLRMATGSDEAMKYLVVSAVILLKIVDNISLSRPIGDKILMERLLDVSVLTRSFEKVEFFKDIDCLYMRASDLVKTELETTKVFVDGEILKVRLYTDQRGDCNRELGLLVQVYQPRDLRINRELEGREAVEGDRE